MSLAERLSELQDRWIESEIGRDWHAKQERIPATIVNRAHSAGHPCLRRLVYDRLQPAEADPIDEGLWSVFREGHSQHEVIRRDLEAMGAKVVAVERPVSWPDLQLTGRIDLVLEIDGEESVWDAKGYSPHLQIRTLDDVRTGPWYLQTAYWQVQLYQLLLGKPGGFILKNKGSARLTFLDVPLDYEGTERILKRLEEVNEHVRAEMLPDREPGAWCDGCEFRRVCGPPRLAESVEMLIDDGRFDVLVSDYVAGEEAADKRDAADKRIRKLVKDELDRNGAKATEIICRDGSYVRAKKNRAGAVRVTVHGARKEVET